MANKRVQNSLGQCYYNPGTKLVVNEEKYILDHSREYYIFDIVPVAAPRMTRRDAIFLNPNHADPKKRQRPAVTKYFAFKRLLESQASEMNFELKKIVEMAFLIPMPASWSQKKKNQMNGMPCEGLIDTDNITKSVKDSLRKNDSDIWWEFSQKRWAYKGSIIIYGS